MGRGRRGARETGDRRRAPDRPADHRSRKDHRGIARP